MASFKKVISIARTFDELFTGVQQALIRMGAALQDQKRLNDQQGFITAKMGMSVWSFGETIEIHITSTSANSCELEIVSEMVQLVGWGKNKTNVEHFERQLGFVLNDLTR